MKRIISLVLSFCMALSIGIIPSFAANDAGWLYYTGQDITPEPTVSLQDGTKLTKGVDYTVRYQNNRNAGVATIIVEGTGKYPDYYQELTFTIRPRPVQVKVADQQYYGANPSYSYNYAVNGIIEGDSLGAPTFSIVSSSITGNVKTDIVTVSFDDADNYAVSVTNGTVTTRLDSEHSIQPGNIGIDEIDDVVYDGTYHQPDVVVRNSSGEKLVAGTDYTLTATDNKDAGTATVYATGKGSYAGKAAKQTFTIKKRTLTITVADVTVKHGESYSGTWKSSNDLANGDSLPKPTMTLPDSSQKPGTYPIKATFPEMKNYNVVVKNGTLTITSNPNYNGNTTTPNNNNLNSNNSNPSNSQTGTSTVQKETYTVTVSNNSGGQVSPSGNFAVKAGENIKFTITPNNGYQVKRVTVNGKEIDVRLGYLFSNLSGDKTVYVEFEKKSDATTDTPNTSDTPISSDKFTDVSSANWYYNAVKYVVDNKLMNGTSSTQFAPNLSTTRGMIVTILHRLEGSPTIIGDNRFTDVGADTYYQSAINWAAANGIVTGYDLTHFGPNDKITREQLATILYRYAKYKNYDTKINAQNMNFSDIQQISGYAKESIEWAYQNELVKGNNNMLNPTGKATRAEVAQILMRFCEKFK